MLIESFLKLWGSLGHPQVYILTNGMEVDTDEGKKKAGVDKYMAVVKDKGLAAVTYIFCMKGGLPQLNGGVERTVH